MSAAPEDVLAAGLLAVRLDVLVANRQHSAPPVLVVPAAAFGGAGGRLMIQHGARAVDAGAAGRVRPAAAAGVGALHVAVAAPACGSVRRGSGCCNGTSDSSSMRRAGAAAVTGLAASCVAVAAAWFKGETRNAATRYCCCQVKLRSLLRGRGGRAACRQRGPRATGAPWRARLVPAMQSCRTRT